MCSTIAVDFLSVGGVALGLVSVISESEELLQISRALIGVSVGMNATVVPLYVKEILPKDSKGK